jgi:hypothetical protein
MAVSAWPGRLTAHSIPARLAMIQKKVCVRAEARTCRDSGSARILELYRLDG